MFRISLLAAILLGCGSGCRRQPDLRYYFPTGVGDRWVYDCNDSVGGDDGEVCYAVTGVEARGVSKVVTVSPLRDGKPMPDLKETLLVSDDGVVFLHMGGGCVVANGPCRFLKLPPVKGEKWDERDPEPGREWKWSTSVTAGVEQVVVPAGTFQAVRVEYEGGRPDGSTSRATSWYAAGYGRVKQVSGQFTWVLKSFTAGR